MPRPLNTLWYSPAKMPSTRRRVRMWIRRTCRRASTVSIATAGRSRNGQVLEDLRDQILGGDPGGLGLVGGQDTMAQHVHADRLDVLGRDIAAALEEGV